MAAEIDLVAVLDKDGGVVLYDIFINGVWHGSRRLHRYCIEYVTQEVPNGHICRTTYPPGHSPDDPHELLAE